jgi:hypothetical protein
MIFILRFLVSWFLVSLAAGIILAAVNLGRERSWRRRRAAFEAMLDRSTIHEVVFSRNVYLVNGKVRV